MKRGLKAAAAILAAALLLTGCGAGEKPDDGEQDFQNSEPEEENETEIEVYSAADSVFSVNYDDTASLNPLYGMNTYNNDVFSLMYEGLFKLGEGFVPQPVLCASYSTEDGKTFTFTLDDTAKFTDGTNVTAADAETTFDLAAGSSKYSSRFKNVIAVNATDTWELTIVLSAANYGFPALLDIPIVKSGTGSWDIPTGSGAYYMVIGSGETRLCASDYYSGGDVPVDTIYLKNVKAADMSAAFSGRTLDIINYDPTGTQKLNIHTEYETRYYDTTTLVYIGFNTKLGVGQSASIRGAVQSLVDVDALCEEVFGNAVTPAYYILNPELYFCDGWECESAYSKESFLSFISEQGFADSNNDGWWESPYYGSFTLTIIVNSENSFKTALAREVAAKLKSCGIAAEVKELSFDDYVSNLKAGTYNMYIGEVKLPADFDLTELLTAGGSLNYGGMEGTRYSELINDFLAADGEDRSDAALELCEYVRQEADIIPVAYKKYAVLTHPGVVSGMEPSQTGAMEGISSWTINMDLIS